MGGDLRRDVQCVEQPIGRVCLRREASGEGHDEEHEPEGADQRQREDCRPEQRPHADRHQRAGEDHPDPRAGRHRQPTDRYGVGLLEVVLVLFEVRHDPVCERETVGARVRIGEGVDGRVVAATTCSNAAGEVPTSRANAGSASP